MNSSKFRVRVQKMRRIAIPTAICRALEINEGDFVDVIITKVEDDEK